MNIFQSKLRISYEIKILQQLFIKIQANDSIICGYFCIGFIDFMLKGKVC